jgi:protein-arginine kinase activator protein McsA
VVLDRWTPFWDELEKHTSSDIPLEVCPACGWTAQELDRTGLLGCGVCYSVFQIAKPSTLLGVAESGDLVT